jgi:hypothetical protein
MARARDEIHEARRIIRANYGQLFDSTAALLFRHDPVGINFDDNTDEYEPEAETILPRLKTCSSPDEVLQVVHQEFVRWFDPSTAGPPERYTQIASEIWGLWQEYLRSIRVS